MFNNINFSDDDDDDDDDTPQGQSAAKPESGKV